MAQVIGQAIDRIDGRAKVTGTAAYAADNRAEPHGVRRHGGRHHRPWAHGRHRCRRRAAHAGRAAGDDARECTQAGAVPGQGRRPPRPAQAAARQRQGPAISASRWPWWWPTRRRAARAAASAIVVTYEKAEGAFVLESRKRRCDDPGKGPTGAPSDSKIGDFDKAFAAAPVKLDATYTTPYQSHARWSRTPAWPRGRTASSPSQRAAAGRDRPQVDRRHAEARARQGPGDLRVHRRRLRRQAAGLWRRHPGGPGRARAQPSGARGADAPADVPCHDASAGLDPARAAGRRTRRHADRDHPPIAGAECAGR